MALCIALGRPKGRDLSPRAIRPCNFAPRDTGSSARLSRGGIVPRARQGVWRAHTPYRYPPEWAIVGHGRYILSWWPEGLWMHRAQQVAPGTEGPDDYISIRRASELGGICAGTLRNQA